MVLDLWHRAAVRGAGECWELWRRPAGRATRFGRHGLQPNVHPGTKIRNTNKSRTAARCVFIVRCASAREIVGSCGAGLLGAPHDSAVMDSSRMFTPNKNKIQTLQDDEHNPTVLGLWRRAADAVNRQGRHTAGWGLRIRPAVRGISLRRPFLDRGGGCSRANRTPVLRRRNRCARN